MSPFHVRPEGNRYAMYLGPPRLSPKSQETADLWNRVAQESGLRATVSRTFRSDMGYSEPLASMTVGHMKLRNELLKNAQNFAQ